LKQILQSSAAYGDSWSESDYLSAVSGLSSAIEHLHVYHLESMNIMLIGCHNDIKPANILVSGKRFILADFGLSTMREGDDSKTPFKVGNGIYKAPECEDYNNDFRPGDIGRSTDIWAFGCIILEVLAYMLTGAEGVAGFRSDRRVEIPSVITTFAFHKGMLPNPGVERWLAKLEDMGSPFTKTLLQEVRKMLSLMPQERPKAARVSSLLNYLVAASTFCVVEDGLSNVSEEFETLDLHIERERFRLLGWVLALDKLSFSGNVSQNPSLSKRFNTLIDPLRETSELVTTALKEGLEASLGVLQRTCNDKIAALLEPNEIQRVKARVYLRFLSSEGDEGGDLSAFVTAALVS
jgi:serine/threonine protein kinase